MEMTFEISIRADDQGYLERQCPSDACRTAFKVLASDWKARTSADVFCPRCGHRADNHQERWATTAQTEAINRIIREQGTAIAAELILRPLRDMARRTRSNFIRIDVTPPRSRPPIPDVPASETLRRKVTCSQCGLQYAVVGSAFFCPQCGHNCAAETFAEAVTKLEKGFEIVRVVRESMRADDPDGAEVHAARVFESTVSDGVVALQRLPQALYGQFKNAPPSKGNVFQRLNDASDIWEQATGFRYESFLEATEWEELEVFFQQRHLLQHADGFVDQKYVDKSGDRRYVAGQRLVIGEADARRMLALTRKLGAGLQRTAAAVAGP